MSRSSAAFIVLVWLRLAGEAALGDQRPVFERQWKGSAALVLALAGAIHLWQRHRRRDRDTPEPAADQRDQPILAGTTTHSTPHSSQAALVKMPSLGEDVIEGTVARWLKQVGDRVEAGEPLFEVSTDKVDAEVPAGISGDLCEIRVPAGRTASVGSTIAVIDPSTGRRGGSQGIT
jgi:biotin carboxyl carrier protein